MKEMRLDEERLREALFRCAAQADSGGCGHYIVMENAIANADSDQLCAIARDYGLALSRFAVGEEMND